MLAGQQLEASEELRIRALIEQAKSSSQSGKAVNAYRLAHRAVQMAERFEESVPRSVSPKENRNERKRPEESQRAGGFDGEETALPNEPESSIYRDGSDDPGISFKMGAPLTDLQAPLAVRMHETTHLLHETQEAILEGRRVYAGIRILSRVDPQTGRQHIAGGRAMVTLFPNIEPVNPEHPTLDVTG